MDVDHVAVDRARLVLLGHEHLPPHHAYRHVHLRQCHLDLAFFLKRRAGMHVDKGHLVAARRREPGAHQRDPCSIRACGRLCRLAGEIDRDNRRARRQIDLQERLRSIAHLELDLGQRSAFAGDQRSRRGVIGDGRQHARVGEPPHGERQMRRRRARRPLIAKRRENRHPRQRV